MKYLRKFESIDSLQRNDIEILSDIFLEFIEKWKLDLYINERGMGPNICQLEKFDPFFINVTVKKSEQNHEFKNDLQNVINRIQKFGYCINQPNVNKSSYGFYLSKINIDGSIKDPYYFFKISRKD